MPAEELVSDEVVATRSVCYCFLLIQYILGAGSFTSHSVIITKKSCTRDVEGMKTTSKATTNLAPWEKQQLGFCFFCSCAVVAFSGYSIIKHAYRASEGRGEIDIMCVAFPDWLYILRCTFM